MYIRVCNSNIAYPGRRELMTRTIPKIITLIFCWLLLTSFFFGRHVMASEETTVTDTADEIGLVLSGTLRSATCNVHFAEDILQLEGVGISLFHQPGDISGYAKPFSLTVSDCQLPVTQQAQLTLNFKTQAMTDMVPPGAFANQLLDNQGMLVPTGIGFSIYDSRDDSNVLDTNGQSRELVYTITDPELLSINRDFYVRYMQTDNVTQAGPVSVVVMVSAIYN